MKRLLVVLSILSILVSDNVFSAPLAPVRPEWAAQQVRTPYIHRSETYRDSKLLESIEILREVGEIRVIKYNQNRMPVENRLANNEEKEAFLIGENALIMDLSKARYINKVETDFRASPLLFSHLVDQLVYRGDITIDQAISWGWIAP